MQLVDSQRFNICHIRRSCVCACFFVVLLSEFLFVSLAEEVLRKQYRVWCTIPSCILFFAMHLVAGMRFERPPPCPSPIVLTPRVPHAPPSYPTPLPLAHIIPPPLPRPPSRNGCVVNAQMT